jgi:putative peptidoglycan lipid II flippase
VSLFGMSVAAAALPELARDRAVALKTLRERTVAAVERVAFYVVPSVVAFLVLGDLLVAGLYQAGEFNAADVRVVWFVLGGYSVGLLASTTTRVYQSAYFALRDTLTPARAALGRVLVALVAGAGLMVQFEPVTVFGRVIPAGALADFTAAGLPLGPLGLAGGAALGAWVEWWWLRRRLAGVVGAVGASATSLLLSSIAALVSALFAYAVAMRTAATLHPLAGAVLVAGSYGLAYIAIGYWLGIAEARGLTHALLRLGKRRSKSR